jgi:hypothetical protein
MSRKPNPPPDDAAQAARFLETAKALEANKTGAGFLSVLGKVTVPSTAKTAQKTKRKRP